jgi:hypothetical protein
MGFIVIGLTREGTVGKYELRGSVLPSMHAYFMSEIHSYFNAKALDKLDWLLYL